MRQFALVLVAAVLPFVTISSLCAAEPMAAEAAHAFPDISKADLEKAVAAKQVTLIDCNGSSSFKNGHIPGALDFEMAHKELAVHLPADKQALVVAYCGGPQCGAYKEGAEAVKALGYTNVKHYSDGITGWKKAGGLLEK